jgi:type IV fimbrial biogenesis protein FimT
MQYSRAIRHRSGGFTLVELMVTVAVMVILGMMAAPALQQFLARSQMSALQNDFNGVLTRARGQAIALNTCVSVCQLADGSSSACNANAAQNGQWHRGWILFESPGCTVDSISAVSSNLGSTAALVAGIRILAVRQPGAARFTLNSRSPNSAATVLTYNAQGLLRNGADTLELRDAQDTQMRIGWNLAINAQGRVMVSKVDPVADASAAAAGGSGGAADTDTSTDTTNGTDAGTGTGSQAPGGPSTDTTPAPSNTQ